MKILITGGSGFIGTHLINLLSEAYPNWTIINVDKKYPKRSNKQVRTYKLDICSLDELLGINETGINFCVHLAALCKEPGYDWGEYFETNLVGTTNLMKYCESNNIKKIIFTSTMMVYRAEEEVKVEIDAISPTTAYGMSKILAEKELIIWKSSNQERTLKIIRPAVVFGSQENGNFSRLFTTLKSGFFPYVGRRNTVKSNIYVIELVKFIKFLIEEKTNEDIYNFAFPEKAEMSYIITQFRSVFKLKVYTPVFSYRILKIVSYFFEFLNSIGLKNSIHHRRIMKLYYSTNIFPENAIKEGYKFEFTLNSALKHWKHVDKELFKKIQK